MAMASSSLPSLRAPATCCTKTRDCLRAALYIRKRSIMTPKEYMERTNKMKTTTSASVPMFLSMSRKSKLGAPASCSRTAKVNKVATIRLLLKFQVTLRRGRRATRVFAEYCYLERRTCPTTGAPPALLVERENHVNGRVHVHRLAIQERRLIAPLANGVKRRLLEQR